MIRSHLEFIQVSIAKLGEKLDKMVAPWLKLTFVKFTKVYRVASCKRFIKADFSNIIE